MDQFLAEARMRASVPRRTRGNRPYHHFRVLRATTRSRARGRTEVELSSLDDSTKGVGRLIAPAGRERRTVRLPRSLPRVRPVAEPISSANAGFFGGGGFYVRVGILAAGAFSIFGLLALRLWSLQVLQGPRYAHQVFIACWTQDHQHTVVGE